MKHLYFLFSITLAACIISCDKQALNAEGDGETDPISPTENSSVEFSDYTLPTCEWKDFQKDSIYVINSRDEFLSHISCLEKDAPAIDFNRYSLLVVHGVANYGIASLTKDLRRIADKEYELVIDIALNIAAVMQPWSVVLQTEKLPVHAVVKLNKKQGHGRDEGIYPAAVPMTVIGQGDLCSNYDDLLEQCAIITNNADWLSFVATIDDTNNRISSTLTEINIDFSQFIIIAVIDQVKGNGGWSIDITDITEYSDKIVAMVENLYTGNSTRIMTQPFQIVKIPFSNKEIIFNKKLSRSNIKRGYIMDYVPCSGIGYDIYNDSAQAVGYNIISENLRDTFETYTLPDYLNKFPLDFFQNTENYRYFYKVEFEYENTDEYIACQTIFPVKYPRSKKIKIISINYSKNTNSHE